MSYPYEREHDYYLSFSGGKDSALILVDLIRSRVPKSNIFLVMYNLSPDYEIPSEILNFYDINFNLTIIREKEEETALRDSISQRKLDSGNLSVFLRGDADLTFKYTLLNNLGPRLGCDVSIAPEMSVSYYDIWSNALEDSAEFVILSVFFPEGTYQSYAEEYKQRFVGRRMNAAEYYDLLTDPSEEMTALKMQTVLVRSKILGGYLISEQELISIEERSTINPNKSLMWDLSLE